MLCMVKQCKTWGIELCESKVTLALNKPAFNMYILDFSKVLMCKIHYDYNKNKYGVTARDADSLMYGNEDQRCFWRF